MSVSDVIEIIEAPMLVGSIKFYIDSDLYETVDYIDIEKYNRDIYEANECGRTIVATISKDKNIPSIIPGTYFCDLQDFKKVDFDLSKVAPIKGNRVLVVEPHKVPYEAVIKDDYRAWQRIVGGNFDCVYPFGRDAFMIVNDEGKIIGLEGNRMVNGDIIAGTFIIARDDGKGGTTDLTDEQVVLFSKQFECDEAYTKEETQESVYMTFIQIY